MLKFDLQEKRNRLLFLPAVSIKVVVASLCSGLVRCAFGVEHNELDRQPVARRATPALRVRPARALIELVATGENRAFVPVMALVEGQKALIMSCR